MFRGLLLRTITTLPFASPFLERVLGARQSSTAHPSPQGMGVAIGSAKRLGQRRSAGTF